MIRIVRMLRVTYSTVLLGIRGLFKILVGVLFIRENNSIVAMGS